MNINKKVALTLTEMLVAMLALAVIIGMAAQIIKPKRISVTPFVYAGALNLIKGNSYIINDDTNVSFALPTPAPAANNVTIPDPYCVALGDAFSTLDAPICNVTCATTDPATCTPTAGGLYSYNFQTSNKVSYGGLNNAWVAEPAPGVNNIKLVVMDTNGGKTGNYPTCPAYNSRTGAGTLTASLTGATSINIGKECFLLAVYPNGNTIPAHINAGGANAGRCALKDDSGWGACQDMNFPFSYDVWETHVPGTDPSDGSPNACTNAIATGTDLNCRLSKLVKTGLSYRDAVCASMPDCRRTADNTATFNAGCPIDYTTRCNATAGTTPVYNTTTGLGTTSAGWDSVNCPQDNPDKNCVIRLSRPKIMGMKI